MSILLENQKHGIILFTFEGIRLTFYMENLLFEVPHFFIMSYMTLVVALANPLVCQYDC